MVQRGDSGSRKCPPALIFLLRPPRSTVLRADALPGQLPWEHPRRSMRHSRQGGASAPFATDGSVSWHISCSFPGRTNPLEHVGRKPGLRTVWRSRWLRKIVDSRRWTEPSSAKSQARAGRPPTRRERRTSGRVRKRARRGGRAAWRVIGAGGSRKRVNRREGRRDRERNRSPPYGFVPALRSPPGQDLLGARPSGSHEYPERSERATGRPASLPAPFPPWRSFSRACAPVSLAWRRPIRYNLRLSVLPRSGRSFNGRTRGSGPRYRGSNPCLPAK